MAKFKLKAPYGIDPVARYEVPFTPDNVGDDNGLVAKANDNGTMIVNKNIPLNSKLRKEAESHEDHHLKDMMDGKLAYDDNAVYHNLDGKGVKRVDRKNFNESDKSLPWERNAYKAGDKMEEKDMRPNPNKLDGPPSMKDDTPLAFQKIGSRHKFGRKADKNRVSINENFGPSMIKKFTPLAQKENEISGLSEGDPTPAGTTYTPTKKEDYTEAFISYNPRSNKFVYDTGGDGTKYIKSLDDLYSGKGKFDYSKNVELDEDSGIYTDGGKRENYNREFNTIMKNTAAARNKYFKENSYFKNNPDAFKASERADSGRGDGSTVEYMLSPDFKWDDKQSNLENMNRMEYVESFYDKDGEYQGGGKLKYGKSEGDEENTKYLAKANPIFKNSLADKASQYKADNFASSNKALQEFMKNHPNTFKLM